MARFVALPRVIDAVQWNGDLDDLPVRWRTLGTFHVDKFDTGVLLVKTAQGTSPAYRGDWIIRGTAGEFYPVERAKFEYKYAPVADDATDDLPEFVEAITELLRSAAPAPRHGGDPA